MKFTVTVTRRSTYEVEAEDYDRAEDIALGALGYSRQKAALVDDEVLGVQVEQDSDVVQVVFTKTGKPYAYAVPEGIDYRIGDKLVVPARFDGNLEVVTVVGTGRGGYTGPLKSVFGKVATPDQPVEVNEDEGFGFCPDCGLPMPSADSKPCGGVIS